MPRATKAPRIARDATGALASGNGSETCSICKWSNTGLLNLGEFARPRWVCAGCCKRAIESGEAAKLRLVRLVKLWRREGHNNLAAEWAYKNQKPISLNRAAFENGLALAKQQCADQLKEAVTGKSPNEKLKNAGLGTPDVRES